MPAFLLCFLLRFGWRVASSSPEERSTTSKSSMPTADEPEASMAATIEGLDGFDIAQESKIKPHVFT